MDDNKGAVRLTFSEAVDISRIDLSKFSDFSTGFDYEKEIRFFEGTPTSTFDYEDIPGPTDFLFSTLMDISENQAITQANVGFSDVTQIWFYAAWKNIEFPEFEGIAAELNWVVDQIHYGSVTEPPTVTTATPVSITTNSATLGGNVTDDGGDAVTNRGIVYSTSPDPDLDDNVVQIGSGTGSFSATVSGLASGTPYYVRAYATNSEDTAFGTEQSFTTLVEVTSINRHSPTQQLTNSNFVVFEVNLSGPVSGLTAARYSLTESGDVSGASISGISGSGSTYLVTVNTGSGDGTLRLDVANSTGTSPTITSLPFTSGQVYTIDKTPPDVTISSTETSPTNASPIPMEIDFSEDVTGFVVGDIAVSGGTLSNFAGSGANYTVDVTPTGDGTVTVDVAAGVAQDAAGNVNTAADQFSIVSDQTSPTVTVSSVHETTSLESIPITVQFSETVTEFAAADIDVVNGAVDPATFVDLGDGEFTVDINPDDVDPGLTYDIVVSIPAAAAEDLAGNPSEASDEDLVITFNTVQPGVVINAAAVNEFDGELYSNADAIAVTMTFDHPVWGFEGTDIDIDNATWSNFTGNDGDTEFSVTIDPPPGTGPEVITMNIDAGVAEDEAGNENTAAAPLVIHWDQNRPMPVISTTASVVTGNSPIPITVDFGEPVQSFTTAMAEAAVSSDGGATFSIQDLATADDEVFTFDLLPDADDTFTIELAEAVVLDWPGNESLASNALAVTFDSERPIVSFHAVEDGGAFTDDPIGSPTSVDFFTLYISFSKPVVGFVEGMIEESNAMLSDFTEVDPAEGLYSVRVEVVAIGEVSILIAEGAVQDEAGNDNEQAEFTISVTRAMAPIAVPVAGPFGLMILLLLMLVIAERRHP